MLLYVKCVASQNGYVNFDDSEAFGEHFGFDLKNFPINAACQPRETLKTLKMRVTPSEDLILMCDMLLA
jgi:hypothetical protein